MRSMATACMVVISCGLLALTAALHGSQVLVGDIDVPRPAALGSAIQTSLATSFLPSFQRQKNATQSAGNCGSVWTDVCTADSLGCSYLEVDRSTPDQLGIVLLPEATVENGWTDAYWPGYPNCTTDSSPHNELDDGLNINDGDAT